MKYFLSLSFLQNKYLHNYSFNSYIASLSQRIALTSDILECSTDEAAYHSKVVKRFLLMPEEELIEKVKFLKECKFNDKNFGERLLLLSLHPITIKNRYNSLLEYGFPEESLSSKILNKYLTLMKKKIQILRKYHYIDNNCNVAENLSSILSSGAENFQHLNDNSSLWEYKDVAIGIILKQYLGFSTLSESEEVYYQRLRHKCLKDVISNINALKDIGFTLDKLRSNQFLVHSLDHDNFQRFLSIPTIASMDTKKVILTNPKIVTTSVENTLKIIQLLQEYNISDEAFKKCFEILTLSASTVEERLKACQQDDFLSLCRHHPRALELVVYHNKAKERLKILEQVKIPYATLSKISSSKKCFNRFIEVGSERYHGVDKIYFLQNEFNKGKQEISYRLKRHPYWAFASLVTLGNNLNYLLKQGFTKEEIFNELILLLYPTEDLENCLNSLKENKELDVCKDSEGNIKRELILPLVLYLLEKDDNFTGNGMWGKMGQQQPIGRSNQVN